VTAERLAPAVALAAPLTGTSAAATPGHTPDSVLGKVKLLLTAFADDDELTLAELSRRTGLPKSTVFRLCQELVAGGLLERWGAAYRLGLWLWEIGQQVPRQRILREAALPFMEDLFVATKETVHLAIRDGIEVLYVEKIMGHRAVESPSRVAGRLPLSCTATGKAMLAYSSHHLLGQVVAAGLASYTPHSVATPMALAAQLERVRRDGVAVEIEETRVGHASLAAPVLGARRTVVAALSITLPTARLSVPRLSVPLRNAAMGLSKRLARG
jgi:DNA-binding IclR family transcriptional regulator